jgi:type II secretory pathway component GspD/PulD (secretin)
MKLNQLKIGTAALALLAGAQAFGQAGMDRRVDLTLQDADLRAAISALTMQTGLQFTFAPGKSEFKTITLQIKGQSAEAALGYIASAAGAYIRRDDNGVFIISGDRAEEAPSTGDAAPTFEPRLPLQKIRLQKGDPRSIYSLLTNRPMDSQAGFTGFDSPRSSMSPVRPTADVSSMRSTGEVNTPDPYRASNGLVLPGDQANQRGGGGGFGGGGQGLGGGQGGLGGGQGGLGGGQGGLGGGQGGVGGGGQIINLQSGDGNLLPPGVDHLGFDPVDNSIIFQGTPEARDQLLNLIAQFDIAPKQVSVSVEFITTSTSLSSAFGMDWDYAKANTFAGSRPGSFARVGDPIFVNYATGNVNVRLRTLLTEGRGTVLTAPKVRTLNNTPAIVSANTSTFIFTSQATNGPGGIIVNTVPVQINISTFLSVNPRINNDGTITAFLQPQISSFGQLRRFPDGTEIPDILQQQVQVVARVKDGETIVIGGLNTQNDTGSRSRIPVLSDLPIIGQLFQGRTRERSDSELLIFVTMNILDDDDYGL